MANLRKTLSGEIQWLLKKARRHQKKGKIGKALQFRRNAEALIKAQAALNQTT